MLDRDAYPVHALSKLYLRRWEMELTMRHLKVTLQMDHLSCKTPENLEREIRLHLLMHNLMRRLMLEAARGHRASLNRLSFAGALAAARRCGEALLQARSQRQRAGTARPILPQRGQRPTPQSPQASGTARAQTSSQTLSPTDRHRSRGVYRVCLREVDQLVGPASSALPFPRRGLRLPSREGSL
ncbi:MAG: transposase, partial [Verrucomicrobia bacterium]|nr:transposase [Verrucomicrobiota bacterium]